MEGVFQTSADGRFITASPSLARMLGYDSPDDLIQSINDIGKDIYAHPKDRARLMEEFNQSPLVTGLDQEIRSK